MVTHPKKDKKKLKRKDIDKLENTSALNLVCAAGTCRNNSCDQDSNVTQTCVAVSACAVASGVAE